jgi:hypothetical protein
MKRHDRLHVDCIWIVVLTRHGSKELFRRDTPSFRRFSWVLSIFRGPVKGPRGGSGRLPLMTGDGPSRID